MGEETQADKELVLELVNLLVRLNINFEYEHIKDVSEEEQWVVILKSLSTSVDFQEKGFFSDISFSFSTAGGVRLQAHVESIRSDSD